MPHQDQQGGLNGVQGILLAGFLLAAGWFATVAPNPPAPVPDNAPPGQFSAMRALAHVRAIAQRSHPIGSPANAAVRDYISARLRDLGLAVEHQSFPHQVGDREAGGVNVMARIHGVSNSSHSLRALALVCHHDSVPTGPGASDDGAAVATLIETARALMAGPVLSNDVILLFTDGEEEPGLAGARAFAEGCSWMNDVGCVFNFEARGVSGPVLMFETSARNGPLIREFAKAAPRPVANSLMFEVYRRMPNDTDFSVFKDAKVPGLNFAFIGEPWHYHAPTDDVAHLSARSLQHEGSYALSLARHFGDLELAQLHGRDAVYFDLFGRFLIHYPGAWAMPLAMLGALLFLGVVYWEMKRGESSPWMVLIGSLASLAYVLIVGTVFRYGLNIAGLVLRGSPERLWHFAGWPYWFTAVGLTVALSVAIHVALRRWVGAKNLALGALAWWLIAAIVSAQWMPGASYVSLWPLLFALLGISTVSFNRRSPWVRFVCVAATSLPTMILVVPLVQGFYVALGPQAMLVPMAVLALVMGALSTALENVTASWRRTSAYGCGANKPTHGRTN